MKGYKRTIAIGVIACSGVCALGGAVTEDEAEAKTSAATIQARIKAKTRSHVTATFGKLYAFGVYGKCDVAGRLWFCDWTGRQSGWRWDGTTIGMLRNGRPYDAFSYSA